MSIAPERILFEDQWLLAVSKLASELVVQGKGRLDRLPLLDYLRETYPGLTPVHRLDFETSGVVLFVKDSETLKKILNTKFEQWKKKYLTLVKGRPQKAGFIDHSLLARTGGLIPARTRYTVLEQFIPCAYVEVSMEKGGLHHQIRKHFAMIEHPLVLDEEHGDKKYNREFTQYFHYQSFFLHASSLEIPHPVTGVQLKVESPLPKNFEEILKKIRKSEEGLR